jgi:hypothetical protein
MAEDITTEELIGEIKRHWRESWKGFTDEINGRVTATEDKLRRYMQDRAILPSPASLARADSLLGRDAKFKDWLASARGAKSAYATHFTNFHIEAKASPLLNAGGTQHVSGVYGPPPMALRLVELLPAVPLSMGAAAEYGRETGFTPGAGIVAEGAAKPVTSIDYANVLCTIRTVATISKASLQSLADSPGLAEWLDSRLRAAVQLKAEDYLLNAAAPDGLLASATAFVGVPGSTRLDQLGAAISQLQASGYTVDGVVMNGADVGDMRLSKDSQQNYLWASPDSSVGTASVWGIPLVVSPSIAASQFLVGAFAQSTILFTRQLLVVEVAYENEDDFIKNLACLRAEERIGSAVPVPAGLLKGPFVA